jgi:UDP-glucose 4-epimerase
MCEGTPFAGVPFLSLGNYGKKGERETVKILVTGAAGSVGESLVGYFAKRGYQIRVLDLQDPGFPPDLVNKSEVFVGSVADSKVVAAAVEGVDAVIHLAWSFADEAKTLLDVDLKGHVELLEAAARSGVKKFLYASTATVYGRALRSPVDEDQLCLVIEARKPLYALTKLFAEDLCRLYTREGKLETSIFRFWWAFGDRIGGRHLRAMMASALKGEKVVVPADSGGTFVTMDDLARAFELGLQHEGRGEVYNIGSFYLTWEQVAKAVVEAAGTRSAVEVVPLDSWEGPRFLSDRWELSLEKVARELGYKPMVDAARGLVALGAALQHLAEEVRNNLQSG